MHRLSENDLREKLSSTYLTDNQRELMTVLYHAQSPLTRKAIAQMMFQDGHVHRLAGVLAELSKRLIPGESNNAYRAYLDHHGEGEQETLSLSEALRKAIDGSGFIRQKTPRD